MPSRSVPAGPWEPLPPHLDPRGRRRAYRRPESRFAPYRLLGRAIGILVSAALLLLAGYVWYTYRGINSGVPRLKVAVGAPPSGKQDIDGTDQNILLVGNDDRTNMTDAEVKKLKVGRDGGSMATDTMMIVHVPANGQRATLISLPRDSYVHIPGYGMSRLNAAYVDGYTHASGTADQKRTAAADLLIKTVQNLTGLTINHYVQVSLMGFYDISNAIGGVNVDLCASVDDTKAANGGDGGSGLVLSKGKHSIKGVQALEFVRQRHGLPHGDLDRVRRQQYFLAAAFRKVASVGIIFKLKALGDAVKRNLYMDPDLNLLDLAHQMENLSANNIIGKTIPTTPTQIDGMDVLQVKPSKVRTFVDKVINPAPATPTTPATHASGTKTGASSGSASPKPLDSKCIN